MILTDEQITELETAAKPLMNWLEVNCHPHTTAIVSSHRAELVEGIANVIKATNAAN